MSYNPNSGYIVTANNAIVTDDYEYFLSRDWDYGYRAARIAHLIERRSAVAPLTAEDMREIQMDNEMWIGTQLASVMGDVDVSGAGPTEAVELLQGWDAQNTASSPAAAYANVLWSNLVQNIFAERAQPLPIDGQARLFTVVSAMLADPSDPLWINEQIDVDGMEQMLALSAQEAYDELAALQGTTVSRWNWGDLHAITLTSDTLGSSGIAPIEALFNRGPFPVGGGASVVNATGWELGVSYATTTVPSMRMVTICRISTRRRGTTSPAPPAMPTTSTTRIRRRTGQQASRSVGVLGEGGEGGCRRHSGADSGAAERTARDGVPSGASGCSATVDGCHPAISPPRAPPSRSWSSSTEVRRSSPRRSAMDRTRTFSCTASAWVAASTSTSCSAWRGG